ncbi:MAG: hypothetical protein M1831_001021 [Alyxoria varia]|nr:MAG: hypothetical protein M1831_001021 [Alyxoria varia]
MSNDDPKQVDRQETTPFLLRLFYKSSAFHRLEDFSPSNTHLPQHLQIYTWPTCTLAELTHLLISALPSLLPTPAAGTRVAFRLVYPDTRPAHIATNRGGQPGQFTTKELGSIVIGGVTGEANGTKQEDVKMEDADGNNEGGEPNGNTASEAADALKDLEGDIHKTLQDARFIIGDYIACAVLPPSANGAVAPPPSGPAAGRVGGFGSGPRRGGLPPEGPAGDGYRRGGDRLGGLPPGDPRSSGGMPAGEWRRGEALPTRRGGFGGGPRGRGRGW